MTSPVSVASPIQAQWPILPGNWTYADLNQFLFKPKAYVKGTKMAFPGLKRAKDRAAVIAYLRAQDDTPEALPASQ